MATTLPTRIRQNVRDHITSPNSPFVLKTTALTKILGYPITLDPEWAMLWKTLQVSYPDNSTFVPSIATVIVTWCDAFTAWLEGEENEEPVEKLLDALKSRNRLEIVIEISSTSTRPVTTWRANKSVFVIALPKGKIPYESTVLAGFTSDLLTLFTASPIMAAADSKEAVGANTQVADEADDWADLDLGSLESHTAVPSRPKQESIQVDSLPDVIPELARIPRPEELTRKPPYWILVRQEGRQRVVIQGSHAPSLACLDEYLKRWCRGEVGRSDRPPVVEIKLQESAFGLGLLHDTIIMEAIRGREVTAMLVLVFVESVLGYAPLQSNGSAGSVWEFKRTKPFR
ncbi:hypothetical protein L207DRAFT_560531 [Hyaloscypha variabilis F]|uniref:Uncharacterized protein n=1 Tax=Hyaloscypha variabilis (strain UAMH 11265 / GT02V1 / F) TaxID=1149755 RepID=A0A2J6SE16_HYAVF|nr:hypothetical protein L207DRAFT_560531 [Hyaloscypha variabilis F]